MEDVWIMDSGCSRHMTGHHKWFSSLNPVSTKEYITFGDNGQGKVLGVGSVSLSAKLSLREVAFVWNMGFNLVSVSQLLGEGFEVHFKKGACRVLDAEETLVFRVDLTFVSGPARCLVASPSADIWKWHRRLGHLSFDLLVRLSSMGLIRGFPKLKAEKDLVCHRYGKMVAASHTPVSQNDVVERKNRTLVDMARTMLDEHRTLRRFWAEAVNTACYIANRIFLRAFLGKTSYELQFGRQPSVKHLRAFGCRCFLLKKAGRLDKFESRCLDGIFLGYDSSSRAFRVWILEGKQVVETCEVSFDETMPCTTLAFELSGTPIFEDEEGADDVGDAGATAPAAAPAPSAMSSDDEGGPMPMTSSSLPRLEAQAEAGPVEDTWEVTSEIVPSRQVQRDHPPHRIIGDLHQCVTRSSETKWVFKNKQGENGMVVRNKARLVAQGFCQKEGIDYEETFVPVARLEAIKILLAFAASKGFKLQQMDVKSAFLNGFIEEKVYVRQPPSFESVKFPDRVYKLRKALYGLKQAPRAWYARLKSFLLKSGYLISKKFEMSLMGKLQFFLGLQIKQGPEGTFVHQAKYTRDILKKFDMGDSKPMTTPMSTNTALDADEDGEAVDQKEFRGMIGSLLYLTATRPDVQFAVHIYI
ncbi:hypothetical protein U9M48_013347 [Paspalum notatum var. saurae]|uniref:Gag-pol polyprotein n=1 Tax=Paspalum notatum var. saurae TaxID=547442 RepID=A0AAQ3T077_PASNO